jgi:nitroreductase
MKTLYEAIYARYSARTYDGRPLEADARRAIESACRRESAVGPMGTAPRFFLLDAVELGNARIGTYGLIKGVAHFVGGTMADRVEGNEDFGYRMEGIILEATALGLGTCWLGGSFNRKAASKRLEALGESGPIPALVSIGYPTERRAFADRVIRAASKGDTRKPWNETCFEGGLAVPLSLDTDDPLAAALEALRAGPSASNKQPWRIARADGALHLFLKEDLPYNSVFGIVKMQDLDMGIAMRHFDEAAAALGIGGAWVRLANAPFPTTCRYIATRTLA